MTAPTDDLDAGEVACEMCTVAGGQGSGIAEPRALGERVVWLCPTHREQAQGSSTDALRTVFQELDGQRSLLPRRAEDRRVFPPRPEGRRKGAGRRRADPVL